MIPFVNPLPVARLFQPLWRGIAAWLRNYWPSIFVWGLTAVVSLFALHLVF